MLDVKQIESVLAANVVHYIAAHVWHVQCPWDEWIVSAHFVLKRKLKRNIRRTATHNMYAICYGQQIFKLELMQTI